MQTIMITGGTGLVGKALCELLLTKGYRVIILSRKTITTKPQAATENLFFATWDVVKHEMDATALQQADYIIHLAGAGVMDKKWTAGYKKEIVDSRVESSKFIVESLKNIPNKVKAVISASAIGFYGENPTPDFTGFEENAEADNNFLGHTCKLWEESIQGVVQLNKKLVILRTGIVLSINGGALKEFIKPLNAGIATILGNGKQIISWIHMNDLCRMFLFAIENETLKGTFNAVVPLPVNNKTLTTTLAKKMRGNFYIPIHVPSFILKLMMGGRSIEILKSATVNCKKIIDAGFKFQFENIETALDDLVKSKDQN